MRTLLIQSGCAVLVLVLALGVGAHETDDYTVLPDRAMADLSPQLSASIFDCISRAVDHVNADIRKAEKDHDAKALNRLHQPQTIADAVDSQLPNAYSYIEDTGRAADSGQWNARYPGKVVGYKPGLDNVYIGAALPIDPRQLFKFWFAPTIKVNGVILGTDKLGHFTGMGKLDYDQFASHRRDGESEIAALAATIHSDDANPFLSENGVMGLLSAGDYSNGDLAANYAGLMFFRNLTEPIVLYGHHWPPILRRDGAEWRFADGLDRNSDLLSRFVSHYWDEALNPGLYDITMRDGMKRAIQQRGAGLLWRHRDQFGAHHTPQYFRDLAHRMATIDGHDYGHRGDDSDLNTLAVCFETDGDSAKPNPAGYTPLHAAVAEGDFDEVERLIHRGDNVNAPLKCLPCDVVEYGSTPLHLAAWQGETKIMDLLITAGAGVNRANPAGITPLHRAAAHLDALKLLLDHQADVHALDHFGCSALHWAARTNSPDCIDLLVQRGLSVHQRDGQGRTPLHDAARFGAVDAIHRLIAHGADPNAADQLGLTPLHLAVQAGHREAVDALLKSHADPNAADHLGMTPLQLALHLHERSIVQRLRAAGTDSETPIQLDNPSAQSIAAPQRR